MIRRIIVLAVAGLVALTGFAFAPAQATTTTSHACRDIGVSNYYVHHWQRIHPWRILHSGMVFREHVCHRNRFRLFRSDANTRGEVGFQRHFLKTDRPHKPTIFCKVTNKRSYFLDLDFYWSDREPEGLNSAERHHYTGWAHRYADQHGCRLFLPKS